VILDIVTGDITTPENPSDIIIGMNSQLSDVTGIGLPFVKDVIPMRQIQLGSVITFEFDIHRRLHMLICHHLGKGGWAYADRHVRYGLDHLEYLDREQQAGGSDRTYSIVKIGTGRVGVRDGADAPALHRAMADSFLPLTLFLYNRETVEAVTRESRAPLVPISTWSPDHGRQRIHAPAVAMT